MDNNNWISTDDELPAFNEKVLVFHYPRSPVMEGRVISIDYRSDPNRMPKGSFKDRIRDNKGFAYPTTHWQKLPSPPQHLNK